MFTSEMGGKIKSAKYAWKGHLKTPFYYAENSAEDQFFNKCNKGLKEPPHKLLKDFNICWKVKNINVRLIDLHLFCYGINVSFTFDFLFVVTVICILSSPKRDVYCPRQLEKVCS